MKKTDPESYERRREIATIKFSLIAPVVAGTLGDETATGYFRRIASNSVRMPDGNDRIYSWQTLSYWLHLYRKGGLDALMPRERLDKGVPRRLSEEATRRIAELVEQFPKITGTLVWDRLHEEGMFDDCSVSVDTVQRYISSSGLRNGKLPPMSGKEIRAWEFAHACDGYEADTAHTLYIRNEDGEYVKTYLIAIIDDHSRMIVGARFFYSDNAVNFQKVWKSAVMRYGRSRTLILDNGSSYRNGSTKLIASRLGTRLVYCRPYTPQGKAKIERFFLSIRNSWLNADDGSSYHGIDELNERLDQWVAEYNLREHSALRDDEYDNHTPMQRFMYDMKDIEPHRTCNKQAGEFQGWLDDCFLHEEIRRVNGDSTVRIRQTDFDVPSQYIGSRVVVRYDPSTLENVYLDDPANKARYRLKRTDRVENGRTKRTEMYY